MTENSRKDETLLAGRESVWDYPRPPRLEACTAHLRVEFAGVTIADTRRAIRVLETSHPPTYYFPPDDVELPHLELATAASFCEFKGHARYWHVAVGGQVSQHAAWSYAEPRAAFAPIRDYLAFYPSRVERCWVDEEPVSAQAGDFYGGWITSRILGPFKGAPGTAGW